MQEAWDVSSGDEPLVAVSLHAGHDLRPEVAALLRAGDSERLREEDPSTDLLVTPFVNRVVVRRSRFEVDLNRPRESCVYLAPEDAWGIDVWAERPPPEVVEASRELHDRFYAELRALLDSLVERWGAFVLLDVHSYNYRRGGASGPPGDAASNPDVNIGSGPVDRKRWSKVVDWFVAELASQRPYGRKLDVRENVRFQGGWLSRWVNSTYPETGLAIAVEFKKLFMDEWSGQVDAQALGELRLALGRAVNPVLRALAVLLAENKVGVGGSA